MNRSADIAFQMTIVECRLFVVLSLNVCLGAFATMAKNKQMTCATIVSNVYQDAVTLANVLTSSTVFNLAKPIRTVSQVVVPLVFV